MMKHFCQINSSAGQSMAPPCASMATACANQSSSTAQRPLPEQKITSTKSSPEKALPSQCGKVISVR